MMVEKLYNIGKVISKELSWYDLTAKEKTNILTCLIIREYVKSKEEDNILTSIATMRTVLNEGI